MPDAPPTPDSKRLPLAAVLVLLAVATGGWLLYFAKSPSSPTIEAIQPEPADISPAAFKRALEPTAPRAVPAPAQWRKQATRAFSDIEHQPQPLAAPLAARLDELRRSALAGDIAAAAQLHIELFLCSELPGRIERLGEFVEAGPSPHWTGSERQTLAAQEAALANIDADTIRCAGITEAQLAQRHRWLEMAAAAGDANAALMYALDGSPLLNDSDEMFRDPQGLLTYKQKATRFVMDAAQRCNIEAMSFVGNGYESGLWFPRDAELGAAFNLVAWRLSSGWTPSPHPGEGDMSLPVEQLAARIYTQYCR